MHETQAVSDAELMAASGDLLHPRETLALLNLANVVSVNVALAINAATIRSTAGAAAGQFIAVGQF